MCLVIDTSKVNQHLVADVMPVLLKSGQSTSREESAEKRKPRRSMQHSAHRSMEIPDRGPCIFYDCVKPISNHKLPECPWTTRNPIYVISKPLLTATLSRLLYTFISIVSLRGTKGGTPIRVLLELHWFSYLFYFSFISIHL
ncbi:hypothetical protein F2Q68_00020425 [Brassica cretica]|uniref:Uncharacterized protein n=1 Tax=Brassica cretica TaxID=69181 RepID=A0A8S9FP92_BRACR|nr:hypothetical protein F2Q68_00020425 [Brassica cretica]